MAIKVQQYIAISAEDVKTSFEELPPVRKHQQRKEVLNYVIL